ncbi:hypothetical protein QZH41_008101, partial [Actinostola sp. cb2023]
PGQSHWTYTVTPDEHAETKANIAYAKLSPTMEVMGKKKALYLSSKDIAGMLQTISSKGYGTQKPTSEAKELAVIQGRIQNPGPTAASRKVTNAPTKEPQAKPQANVGGKVQIPPVAENEEDKDKSTSDKHEKKEKGDKQDALEKPQEKLTVTGNKEIDNKLLNLMSSLVSGAQDKGNKLQDKENNPQNKEDTSQDKEKNPQNKEDTSQEKEKNPPNKEDTSQDKEKNPQNKEDNSQEKEKKPDQGSLQNLQITIPNLLQVLEKINGKSKSDAKENKTNEQPGSGAHETQTTQGGNKDQELDAKSKTLLAAMKLVKSVGPLPPNFLNNSSLMEQLRAATEEASVAMKLLNKTGTTEKEKEKPTAVGEGNVSYNVQLLQEELNKHLSNQTNAAESTPKADSAKGSVDSSSPSNPQIGKFIVRLQDAINAQQSQPSAATSITGRGGVAVKEEGGKPTLSEIIPFDIKIDNDDDNDFTKTTPVESKGSKKDKQLAIYESDEQKIMNILNGLEQNDSKKKKNKDDGSKEVVKEIRSSYSDLGEIINGVEQDEGIKKAKRKKRRKRGRGRRRRR